MSEYLLLGRFGKVYGIQGWIGVYSFTDPAKNIFDYNPWHIGVAGSAISSLSVERTYFQKTKQTKGRVKIQGIHTPEQAQSLVNQDIFVTKTQLPILPFGEYYWHQLEGLRVYLQGKSLPAEVEYASYRKEKSILLGTVTEWMPTGANDVMVVLPTPDSIMQKKHLIPYVPGQTIIQVDLIQRFILVDWFLDY